jgi:transglutaminase-like putative cysteine protease
MNDRFYSKSGSAGLSPAPTIVLAAKKSGYCGALAWSLLATDRSSGIELDNEATRG